jgi:hypothetical protein
MPNALRYRWSVAPDADTPLAPGDYLIHIEEGGTYRSLASRRKYTVDNIDSTTAELTYSYTRGDGEHVTVTGEPTELAVVEAVGDTDQALLEQPGDGTKRQFRVGDVDE